MCAPAQLDELDVNNIDGILGCSFLVVRLLSHRRPGRKNSTVLVNQIKANDPTKSLHSIGRRSRAVPYLRVRTFADVGRVD